MQADTQKAGQRHTRRRSRSHLAVTLTALAVLSATACGSGNGKGAAPAAAPEAPQKTAAATATASAQSASTPTPSPSPASPEPPAAPRDVKVRTPADFCKDREALLDPAVRTVISIAGVEEQKQGGFNVLGATEPELKCGPGVDNDGYFEVNLPLGPYYLAPDARIHLLTYDEKATQGTWQAAPASVATLREVVKACKTGEQPSKPYTCGGNLFHATVNKNGVITDLTAVFQS